MRRPACVQLGNRSAALPPISMRFSRICGWTSAGVARGLALWMDHGSEHPSVDFTDQIKL